MLAAQHSDLKYYTWNPFHFDDFLQVIYTPQPANPPAPQPQVQQAPAPQVRKQLTLTKEQMFEAQEMFRTANKVTRPEKALILGFMAGSRDNPCPHLGKNENKDFDKRNSNFFFNF